LGNQRLFPPSMSLVFWETLYRRTLMITRVSQALGKMEPTDEEIRNWIKEGWHFSRRTSKGHIYLTRRKGANLERGLGRFKQTLWDRIEKIKRESSEPQKETDQISLFYRLIELNRASQSSLECMNIDDGGFCTYWRWGSDCGFLRFKGDLDMKEVNEEGNPVFLFRAEARYCKGCNAYVSLRMKASTT